VRPTVRWLARRASRNQLEALRDAFSVLGSIAATRDAVEGVATRPHKRFLDRNIEDAERKLQDALAIVLDGIAPTSSRKEVVTLREAADVLRKGHGDRAESQVQSAIREAWRLVYEATVIVERAGNFGRQRVVYWVKDIAAARSSVFQPQGQFGSDAAAGDVELQQVQLQQSAPWYSYITAVLAYCFMGITAYVMKMFWSGRT
jgi:hypothetical protein